MGKIDLTQIKAERMRGACSLVEVEEARADWERAKDKLSVAQQRWFSLSESLRKVGANPQTGWKRYHKEVLAAKEDAVAAAAERFKETFDRFSAN